MNMCLHILSCGQIYINPTSNTIGPTSHGIQAILLKLLLNTIVTNWALDCEMHMPISAMSRKQLLPSKMKAEVLITVLVGLVWCPLLLVVILLYSQSMWPTRTMCCYLSHAKMVDSFIWSLFSFSGMGIKNGKVSWKVGAWGPQKATPPMGVRGRSRLKLKLKLKLFNKNKT